MDYSQRVAVAADASAAFADALRGADPTTPVPSCPGWTLGDLAEHVWGFTGFWTHALCEGAGRPKQPFAPLADAPDPATGYDEVRAALLEQLNTLPGDSPAWTWKEDDQHAAFIARRVAHELTIHRYDAQLARGNPQPVDPDVAADGIDEAVMIANAFRDRWAQPGSGRTLHLHGTDRGHEWMITVGPDAIDVDHTHGKADMAVRGAVSDLELLVYQRPLMGEVERFGDDEALASLYAAFTFG